MLNEIPLPKMWKSVGELASTGVLGWAIIQVGICAGVKTELRIIAALTFKVYMNGTPHFNFDLTCKHWFRLGYGFSLDSTSPFNESDRLSGPRRI